MLRKERIMSIRRFVVPLSLGLLLVASRPVQAQIALNPATASVEFDSPDHTAVVPAGQVNAGQPKLSSYQAILLSAAADAVSGAPLFTGPVIAKSVVTAGTLPTTPYKLTFAQMGLTVAQVPACTTLPCPQYTIVLLAIGPNGTSARGISAESPPFTSLVPAPGTPPAGPTNVVVKP
jgi:hypothetical protein